MEEDAAGKTSAAYRSPELTSCPYPGSTPFGPNRDAAVTIDERVDSW